MKTTAFVRKMVTDAHTQVETVIEGVSDSNDQERQFLQQRFINRN